MGKRSDELQREIREYRQRLDQKADRLNERVRSDVRDSRENVDKNVRERLNLDKYAEERPLLTLAAAFGTGVLLGSFTPSVPTPSMPSMPSMPGRNGGSARGHSNSGTGGSGMLASLIGSASGALSGTIEDEVREIFSQISRGRDDRQSAGRAASSREDVDRHAEREHDTSETIGAMDARKYAP
jgi:ElaB/YqjD/DUF883 family membrane-anchored ribosome-binding protein